MMETINVIEVNGDGLISSLRSWPNTAENEVMAKECFRVLCRETTSLDDEEIEQAVEDCFVDVGDGANIQFVRSNNWAD